MCPAAEEWNDSRNPPEPITHKRRRNMAKMTWLERRYRRSRLDYVRHITIDPRGPGVVRIHMIPPRTEEVGGQAV
mgnify:CR=1 FL=1